MLDNNVNMVRFLEQGETFPLTACHHSSDTVCCRRDNVNPYYVVSVVQVASPHAPTNMSETPLPKSSYIMPPHTVLLFHMKLPFACHCVQTSYFILLKSLWLAISLGIL